MTPYYLGPPLIMILVVASIQSNKRFGTAVVVAVETLVLAYNRVSPWAWWIPVVIAMSALLALSRPPSSGESRTSEPPNEDEYDRGATLGQSREPESSLPRDPVAVAG
jgi:cell division protein FtsW (lipid II flippase)